jgi:Sec7-like guanine-nucleotide exchange factor
MQIDPCPSEEDYEPIPSLRAIEWSKFSKRVFNHIETYTVPQYGDKGNDQCSEFSESDFITQMKKYLNRYGKNSREGQQRLDLLKIAHYAGMLYTKLAKEAQEIDKIIKHEN